MILKYESAIRGGITQCLHMILLSSTTKYSDFRYTFFQKYCNKL